jgi:hypothetical protein
LRDRKRLFEQGNAGAIPKQTGLAGCRQSSVVQGRFRRLFGCQTVIVPLASVRKMDTIVPTFFPMGFNNLA